LAVPAVLGLRSGDFFFSGVDAVFDFITEKPLNCHPTLIPDQRLLHNPLPKQRLFLLKSEPEDGPELAENPLLGQKQTCQPPAAGVCLAEG
jgi:hypothetical protein